MPGPKCGDSNSILDRTLSSLHQLPADEDLTGIDPADAQPVQLHQLADPLLGCLKSPSKEIVGRVEAAN